MVFHECLRYKVIAVVKKHFKSYPIGYFHIDIARCKQHRVSFYILPLPLIALPSSRSLNCILKPVRWPPREFLRNLIKAVPYRIHTVLTDNGIQFTNRTCDRYASEHILIGFVLNVTLNIVLPRLSIHGPMDR